MANFNCKSDQPDDAPWTLACDAAAQSATAVYLLGNVIVPGTEIQTASALAPNVANGQTQWSVQLSLKSSGQTAWAKYTTAHHSTSSGPTPPGVDSCGPTGVPCAEYVAFTLDQIAISVPHNESAINGQNTEISGSFTQASAEELANQLKYGALPLSFEQQSSDTITATLGSSQLKAGLLAGGIGLILVVLYSLLYYRALGLITIASLLVSGGLTYACLVILGREIGFTLTLAGIAGFIVAVGITADSFVVFFERIKDEVHEGRSFRVAVPRAWTRARRTILSADTVSFLAAAVLYYFAAGDVKGFAFTLGLSTILDLVVVFLFTHPMVSLLSRSRAFGSARFTGLNALRAAGAPRVEERPEEAAIERARLRRAARAARTQRSTPGRAGVVLLEKDIDEDVDRDVEDVEPATDADLDMPAATAPVVAPTEAEPVVSGQPNAESSPRARTAPQPGSAAERAAARRAKLRAERSGDSKGQG
jgi:preprotein translocase subunit SecD